MDNIFECESMGYSFNVQSELFPTLNKEQQELWKSEVEHAFANGAKWQKEQMIKGAVVAQAGKFTYSNGESYAGFIIPQSELVKLNGVKIKPKAKIIIVEDNDQ